MTIAHEARSHANGGVALGANGLRGFVIHGDDLAGVNDFDGKAGGAWITAEAGLDLFLRADQEHAHAEMMRLAMRPPVLTWATGLTPSHPGLWCWA